MNNIPLPPVRKNRFLGSSFTFCALLWALKIGLIGLDVGPDLQKIYDKLSIYIIIAGGLLAYQAYIHQFHPEKKLLLKGLYMAQIVLISFGIVRDIHVLRYSFDEEQRITIVVQTVKDSTEAFEARMNMSKLYTDCEATGTTVKKYRDSLVKTLLKDVPEKKRPVYITRVDSAVVDPVKDFCAESGRFAQMLVEMSLLIRTKDLKAIDEFFDRYGIDHSAKAYVLIGQRRILKGLLRDYIADMMQEFQPAFLDVQPPGYVKAGNLLNELSFFPI